MSKRILIIDDEQLVLDTMDSILTEMGYSVVTCPEPDAGEREAVTRDFDLVLVDIRMPRTNGAELTESILGARPESRILVITGYPSDPLVQRALEAGARGVVKKPFEIAKVLEYLPDATSLCADRIPRIDRFWKKHSEYSRTWRVSRRLRTIRPRRLQSVRVRPPRMRSATQLDSSRRRPWMRRSRCGSQPTS